jgi:RHS repeat-associated protein
VSSSSGAGSTAYGFAGEQVDGTGLSYNRARYYSAYLNQFIQPDPIVPNWRDPRTLNRYAYSYNNPINLTDPSGYDPYWCEGRNDETECYLTYQGYGRGAWKAAGGWEQSYYPNSLSFVLAYRKHIIAAAQRHSFIPASIAQASREQLDVLYTLAAILYQEHHGQEVRREEWSGIPVEDIAAYLGIRNPNTGLLPTIGLCQIRPDTTAVEIETLGLLYQPGTFDEPLTTPVPFEERKDAYPPYAQNVAMVERVERLLDPLWAIEYAAANMELATKQAQYSQPWMSHSRPDDVLQPWEKMTGWYARGHFNVNLGEYGKGEQDIKFYLDYTYADRVAIERLDVLGIKSLFR